MRRSWLTSPAFPVNGLPTSSTPGTAAAAWSASRIAVGACPSASVCPSGTAKTSCADSPDCCGKRCSSRSVARWASESGMVNSLTRVPPMVALPATIATATTTQMAIVRQPWRAHARARRASAPSWTGPRAVTVGLSLMRTSPTCRTATAANVSEPARR